MSDSPSPTSPEKRSRTDFEGEDASAVNAPAPLHPVAGGVDASIEDLLNLCPHALHIEYAGASVDIPASGVLARLVSNARTPSTILGGIPCVEPPSYTGVEGLPGPTESGAYRPIAVSLLVGDYLRYHPSVYPGLVVGPDTDVDQAIRNERGVITGTRRLVVYKH